MASGDFEAELEGIPTARKGPPRWMILTGCGCLIPGFLFVATAAWFLQLASGLVNKDEAWGTLGGLVRYEDSARGEPTGLDDNPKTPADESRTPGEFELLIGGEIPFSGGVEAFWFGRGLPSPGVTDQAMGDDPLSITLVKLEQSQAEKAARAPAGTPLHEDRTYEVKGKTLRGRVVPEMVNDQLHIKLSGLDEVHGAGAVVWLREGFTDPEEKDKVFDLLAFFQRPGSLEPIKDEEVEDFLAPFDLDSFPGSVPAEGGVEDGSKK